MNLAGFLKTGILFAALTAILILIGYYFGGANGAIVFFGFSLIMNLVSFWFSDKIALKMAGGKELTPQQAPEIYQDMQELATTMELPIPKLYMSDAMQPNAFATGRGPNHSAVLVTQGLLNTLSREEVRGVLAHELAHIKNRDVLTATIAAVLAGAISAIAQIGFFMGGSDEDRPNPVAGLLFLILGPIAAAIIQFAISRSREFAADETAALATKKPMDLAQALQKIEAVAHQVPMQTNSAMASLYIQNPLHAGAAMRLFSTHPATVDRVKRLQMIKDKLGV